MEPNVFLGYLKKGIAGVLNAFGHEQYPFNNLNQIIQPMVFTMLAQ